jgi:membrane dipeptidase
MIIVDAHEDLAYNVLVDGRNYLEPALATRAGEAGGPVPESNGQCMLGLPDWLQGGIAVIFATLTTIPRPLAQPGELGYPSLEASHQQALAQLNIYRRWSATHPQITLIKRQQHLDDVLKSWSSEPQGSRDPRRVGLVLLMENADSIRTPEEVNFWWDQGLRLIGPAWHANRFTGSTKDPGPLTRLGRLLLKKMQDRGVILDLSHMAEEACFEALDRYDGPIVATHANPQRLMPHHRNLSDALIKRLITRDGVVGIMPANWALDPEWRRSKGKADIHVQEVAIAIDIVCQIAGDAWHAGLGTDFDGGFGAEAVPAEIDTIADLPKVAGALERRGYRLEHVEAVLSDNWLRVLRQALPE